MHTMRSKGMPARALFRLVIGQTSASSTSASTATAAASSSSSSSSSAATTAGRASAATPAQQQQRQQQRGTHVRRRLQHQNSAAIGGNGMATSSTAGRSRRGQAVSRYRQEVDVAFVMQKVKSMLGNAPQSPRRHEGTQARVPPTSRASVATQSFFAHERPLLEYLVVPRDSDVPSSMPKHMMKVGDNGHQDADDASMPSTVRDELAQVKHLLQSAHSAFAEVIAQSSKMSSGDLARTTFVIAPAEDEGESSVQAIQEESAEEPEQRSAWAKRLDKVDSARFNKLIDRLATPDVASAEIVEEEVRAISEEEEHKRKVESAVENALEFGEDPAAALALGDEANLVVLGEPKGPNPAWPRGVATRLTMARAFEPPAPPKALAKDGASADYTAGTESRAANVEMADDDPNLLLSHAMVQARLPPALAWDRLVAQMDQATLDERQKEAAQRASSTIVDVTKLNAEVPPPPAVHVVDVSLDSVKRKRRKKMRKHKYRKLRKATRTERSRLKK